MVRTRGRGGEELPMTFVAAVHGDEHDGGAVDGEEGADGVELGGEDFEDDEGEGELAEGGPHVGAFEGALGGADLDESGGGMDGSPAKYERREARDGWSTVGWKGAGRE